ncbi:Sterol uptake control protein 2 [Pleurostoma richardsiae]|uniref:Sterol uptake control protein 2 n=1 Tax=Pleurostoma richardsiae TaxID=41990 RepID=A0AA38VMA9_9PEZI|nr:Sterol uptake control protein 2 [Pleurostoma richardsiae]
MDDLRFFQHFLLHAYPPLPIRGVAVWRDVAALCHSYDYLVHAMLGLAASHLSLGATTSSRTSFTAQAFEHRVTAINLLNQALSEPCASKAEGDARFAAIMSLTFQSSYMPEGMLDFLSMIRGCTVVSHSAMPAFEDSMFRSFSLEGHIESLRSLNQGREDSPEDEGLVDAFLSSIRAVGALCRSTMEVRFLAAFEAVVKTAKISAVDSFAGLSAFYMIFGQATNEDFKAFRDPGNFAAQILLAHFFLVEYMIGAIALQPIMGSFPFRKEITVAWIRAIADKLPAEYDQHIRWPLEFAEFLLNDKSRGALPE